MYCGIQPKVNSFNQKLLNALNLVSSHVPLMRCGLKPLMNSLSHAKFNKQLCWSRNENGNMSAIHSTKCQKFLRLVDVTINSLIPPDWCMQSYCWRGFDFPYLSALRHTGADAILMACTMHNEYRFCTWRKFHSWKRRPRAVLGKESNLFNLIPIIINGGLVT